MKTFKCGGCGTETDNPKKKCPACLLEKLLKPATRKTDRDVKAGKAKCSGHEVACTVYLTVECGERKAREYMDSIMNWLQEEMGNVGEEIVGVEDGQHAWSFTSQKKPKFRVRKF